MKVNLIIYIGYFTAWVNNEGELNFFQDIYDRDERLAKLIFSEN